MWLLCILLVRGLAHQALAFAGAKQLTAAEAAKTFSLEWRMEATAHVASLMVRDQQCKGDPENCDLQEGASDAIERLSKWAVGDKGWERLLSSVSLYAIARHAYQEAEYDEAIIALEESLALRLFAYADQKTLDRWQQGLVMPGSMFRRQKMDLANTLVLRADCLVQLAREQRDVDDLTEAVELLQLATALLKGGDELVPDSVTAITRRASTIAQVALELLPQLKTSRVKEVLERHGITCTGCTSKSDYLVRLVPLLRLPVRVLPQGSAASSSSSGSGATKLSAAGDSPLLEPLPDPFNSHATALLQKPSEHVAQYMQRVFFRLLTLVPADYLAELEVSCRRHDSKGRCINYLPLWVTAQAITIDKRTGMAHVSGPGACAGDGDGSGDNPSLDLDGRPGSSSSSSSSSRGSSAGGCGSSGGALHNSQPLFVPGSGEPPGDAAAGGAGAEYRLPAPEPHNRAGVELCGFLHIRAIPPGVNLPTTGGSLTPQQQKVLKDKAAEASGAAASSPFKGVYYYFYSDIPALVDRIINTFDPEEADFLFEQLDGLTAAASLSLAGRLATPQPPNCNEQSLLEGRAPPACSVLVPNIGSCAKAPLKPPRRRIPVDPLPPGLAVPPPAGTYTPRMRARASAAAAAAAAWGRSGGGGSDGGGAWGDGANGSGERDGEGSGSEVSASGRGHRARHHHHARGAGQAGQHGHAHGHYPLTDRELSDRQLQEQMAKLARDAGRRERDDPLVPLTLAGCAVASFGLYLATKRRRRSSAGSSGAGAGGGAARLVLLGLGKGGGAGPGSSGSGSGACGLLLSGAGSSGSSGTIDAGGGAGEGGDEYDGAATVTASTTQQRRLQALDSLKVAMHNKRDTEALEAAVANAEAAAVGETQLRKARAMLDKRRKKDQQAAAAERARLKAQRKEEARRNKKAATAGKAGPEPGASGAAAAAGGGGRLGSVSSSSSAANLVAAGDAAAGDGGDSSSSSSSRRERSALAPSPGRFVRLLQMFGLGACGTAGLAATGALSPRACDVISRASSGSLSRTSSAGPGVLGCSSSSSGPSPEPGAGASGSPPGQQQQQQDKDATPSKQQQQQRAGGSGGLSRGGSGNGSVVDLARAAAAAADSSGGEAVAAAHLLSLEPISVERNRENGYDVVSGGSNDVSDGPITVVASAGGTAAAAGVKDGRTSTSISSPRTAAAGASGGKRGKGGKGGHQHAAVSVRGRRGSADGGGKTSKAPSDAAEAAAMVEAVQLQQEQAAKAKARAALKAAQAAAVAAQEAAAAQAALAAAAGGKPGGQQEQQQLQRTSLAAAAAAAAATVVPPVTPPASAHSGSGSGGRAMAPGGQQQQMLHGVPGASPWGSSGGGRMAAVSEDGGSSTSSMQQGSTTPSAPGSASKPKLNPRATPYNPSSTSCAVAAVKAAANAANTSNGTPTSGRFSSPGGFSNTLGSPSDWRASPGMGLQGAGAGAAGGGPLGVSSMLGAAPELHGMLALAGQGTGDAGMQLSSPTGGGSGGPYGSQLHARQQQLALSGGLDAAPGGPHQHQHQHLMAFPGGDGSAAAAGAPPGFDRGSLALSGGTGHGLHTLDMGLVSPQHGAGPQHLTGLPSHQQQLLELMSAAGPSEPRFGGISSAGGSAPLALAGGNSSGSGGQDALLAAAAAAASQRSSYSSVPDYALLAPNLHALAAAAGSGTSGGGRASARGAPPGFDHLAPAAYGSKAPGVHLGGSSGGGRPGVLPLSLDDDDQLPPGFSAEDYSSQTPSGSAHAPYLPTASLPMSSAALAAAATPPSVLQSPVSIPTTAPLGVFAAGSSVWGPLTATAGSAASSVAASVRSLWPTPAPTDNHHGHHHNGGGYAGGHMAFMRSHDLEVEVAAEATSTNVAEHVLGSSPGLAVTGSDAEMSKLAKEIMAIVAE